VNTKHGGVLGRRVAFFLVAGAVIPLAFASSASAQGAVLKLSTSVASPGQTITASGRGFSNVAGVSGVTIRLSTRAGRVIAPAVTPDTAGKISVTFPVPANVSPGWYLVLGTQTNNSNGSARSFTPGRTTLRVQGAASGQAATAAPPGGTGGPGSVPVLLAALLALLVLGAGAMVTARRLWTLNRPPFGV
jgi:hypothetical protein